MVLCGPYVGRADPPDMSTPRLRSFKGRLCSMTCSPDRCEHIGMVLCGPYVGRADPHRHAYTSAHSAVPPGRCEHIGVGLPDPLWSAQDHTDMLTPPGRGSRGLIAFDLSKAVNAREGLLHFH